MLQFFQLDVQPVAGGFVVADDLLALEIIVFLLSSLQMAYLEIAER
ncbi:hypothetical protein BAG01nite_49270 [Brevibacillus agri]|uniref:DUF1232 domain-containing protein n=1 Tax=Brevibacillus agri TaxID=51101 RepID=A0ABQ0T054_9BACL|nr:hypothetical protein [Brevibacillus agri]GED28825.1 hypothetical protein BAG01nite_49270 [Brevibacillus agri]